MFDDKTGRLTFGKALSTPDRLVDGISSGVDKAGSDYASANLFLHGSTIAINTILERTGAKTALLTTEGFRDVYEIGRINRPDAYNLFFQKHVPLVERALRFEVAERVRADGEVLTPLDEQALAALGDHVAKLGMDAVAIMFINCYANPAHEARAHAILSKNHPGLFVSASHELSQEYREFERCSTVVANAYIGPKVRRYVGEIDEHIRKAGFPRLVPDRAVDRRPVRGRAGADAMRAHAGIRPGGRRHRHPGAVPHAENPERHRLRHGRHHRQGRRDLQGRGADHRRGADRRLRQGAAGADRHDGHFRGRHRRRLDRARRGRHPARRPAERRRAARARPATAWAASEPTVTDANLVLGRLGADRFLGGEMKLDVKAAERALARVGKPLGMSATEAADGILRIAATAMSYAVKGVTTERGLDAGDFALVAYGGAGPLHAVAVAREIGIRNVIVPGAPGVFSAFGMLFSDLRYDYVRTHLMQLADAPFDDIEAVFRELEQQGRDAIAATSVKPQQITVKRALDMRYVGQEHPVTVDLPMRVFQKQDRKAIKQHFDDDHMQRYGTSAPAERAEIVSLRTTVTGLMKKPPLEKIRKGPARRRSRRFPASARCRSTAASATRRPTGAPNCWPATRSTGRR